jgi:hypothetical protein
MMALPDVTFLLVNIAAIAYVVWRVARLPAVWRGASFHRRFGVLEVNRRSYLIFVVEVGLLCAGLTLGGIGLAVDNEWLRRDASFALMLLALSLLPVHLVVNAFNRPRFLVPPDLRHEPGWEGERQEARRRRAAGRPPTSHPVQILDVRAPPDEQDAYPPPFFYASCTIEGCGWQSAEIAQDAPEAEATVRRYAASHSDNVLPDTERLLG